MIDYVRMEASKLGFGVVIAMSNNGSSNQKPSVIYISERSGAYVPKIRKLKHEDTRSRKCGCLFNLRDYCRVDNLWRLTTMSGMHNHELETKLHGHPIVCRLKIK